MTSNVSIFVIAINYWAVILVSSIMVCVRLQLKSIPGMLCKIGCVHISGHFKAEHYGFPASQDSFDLSGFHRPYNSVYTLDLKVALCVCPNCMDNDIHSDHNYHEMLGKL